MVSGGVSSKFTAAAGGCGGGSGGGGEDLVEGGGGDREGFRKRDSTLGICWEGTTDGGKVGGRKKEDGDKKGFEANNNDVGGIEKAEFKEGTVFNPTEGDAAAAEAMPRRPPNKLGRVPEGAVLAKEGAKEVSADGFWDTA